MKLDIYSDLRNDARAITVILCAKLFGTLNHACAAVNIASRSLTAACPSTCAAYLLTANFRVLSAGDAICTVFG